MEDYIVEYPDQYDPDIQRKITCKQEFNELSGKTYEPPPKRGDKYSHQEYFLRLMRQYDRILKFDSPGSGKCQKYGTLILMFDGSIKKIEDIVNGDKIMGPDSKSRTVINTTKGRGEMFEVIPNKGRSFTCNKAHVLTLMGAKPLIKKVNNKCTVKYTTEGKLKSKVFTTEEEATKFMKALKEDIYDIELADYMTSKINKKYAKLFHVGIEFPDRPVPIDPYMIGYCLGNGDSKFLEINDIENKVNDYEKMILSSGENFIKKKEDISLNVIDDLNNKHIPDIYKINSREKRFRILKGLINSNNTNYEDNYEIIQKSKQLADDIEYLCFSLGLMVTKELVIKDGEYWKLNIFKNEIFSNLEGKKCENLFKDELCHDFTIKPVGIDNYAGFQLTGDGRYLLDDFLVTHNSCTMVGLAEYYSNNPGEYEHIYILEKGPSTLQDMRHQIVCRCTKDKYETNKVKQAMDAKSRSTNITNVLKSWYTITTYKKFASEILTMTDVQIKAKYSRCHIYIDEAHALRNVEEEARAPKKSEDNKKKKIVNSEAYKMIWKELTLLIQLKSLFLRQHQILIMLVIVFPY